LLRIAICVYVILCVIVFFAQDWLCFPGMMQQGTPETKIQYGGDAEVVHLTTANGIPIAAVFGLAKQDDGSPYPGKNDRPTILYFYGNAGAVAWSEGEFDHFRQLHCNVLIPDLAGFGASGGKPSEANFDATADAAWNYLQTRPDIDRKKIIAVGWSMGAGVAVDLASRKPVIGLATFNAFTSLTAMARRQMPYLPTTLMLKNHFNNQQKIAWIHCPMLICNGQLDQLVPPQMSDDLATHAGGPVTRVVIPEADHNTIFTANPEMVWEAMGELVQRVSGKDDQSVNDQ
jgi:fermentation-respiration switch protein FrsA (DUF1100 family)